MTRRTAMATLLTPALPDLAATDIQWRNLPDLPKAVGGQFAGMAGDEYWSLAEATSTRRPGAVE